MPVEIETLPEEIDGETEQQAAERIAVRYDAMQRLAARICAGKLASLIISGPPGLGKSYTLEMELRKSRRRRFEFFEDMPEVEEETPDEDNPRDPGFDASNWYDRISGGCTAPGLYQSFWNMRNGGLVLIDDCDSVFEDIESLNLIKIATDSSKERILSWRKRAAWLSQYQIPKSFEFRGHVVFLTNKDFEQIVKRSHKDVEHYKALIDRAHYLCLTLRTQRDFMIRIRAVAAGPHGMLQKICGLTEEQTDVVLNFVEQHKMRFYNLSLRLVNQIAETMLADPGGWEKDIEATKMKTGL